MSPLLLSGWLLAVASASLLLVARRHARDSAERIVRACHELRGPLQNVLLGLGDGQRSATVDPLAGALAGELSRAARAVDDLAGVATGVRRRDERRPIDVGPLVRDLVAVHDVVARTRGRRVVLATPDAAHRVVGDRARLAQALGNLVANAVEHGSGTVRVGVVSADGAVRVEVADEGRGLQVPVEDLLRRPARGRRGRGMRIVTDALTAHGGRLRSASTAAGHRMIAELPPATTGAAAR